MKPRLLKRMTIATRLLWAFRVMALVPLSMGTYLIYTTSEQALRAEVTNNLRAIADSKANQIETYARARQRNVTVLARMPSHAHAFEPLDQAFRDHGIGSPEYTAVEGELRPFLSDYLAQSGYADVLLLSPSGDAIFSARQGKDLGSNLYTGPNKDTELARVFDRAKTRLVTEVSNFAYYAAEAFAPIVKQRNAMLIVGSITLFLVVAGALIVARSISNPIIALTRAVCVIAGGNLQQSVPIVRHDEIGELSQAFNTMTADLRQIYETIEETVRVRTQELHQSNAELERARQEAAAATQAKSTFLANMSHELRTPRPRPQASTAVPGWDWQSPGNSAR